jgi:hypothetical protein
MQALRSWPFGKVLLACVASFLLSVVVMAGWLFFQASGFFQSGEGSGVGGVHISINALLLAIPFIPPMVLIVAWLVARRATPI